MDRIVYAIGFRRLQMICQSGKATRSIGEYGLFQKGFFVDLMIEPTMEKQEYVLNTNGNQSPSGLELHCEIHPSQQNAYGCCCLHSQPIS